MCPSYACQIPLAPYTTFHIGGPAVYLMEAHTMEDVRSGVSEAHAAGLPLTILGGGSNVLIADEGMQGCVLIMRLKGVTMTPLSDTVRVTAAAGELLDDVVAQTVLAGYWGLENLSCIPGTVGAAPVQNVGAYGVEVGELIESVQAVHCDTGEVRTFTRSECQFAYRDSFFKSEPGRAWIITAVTFLLSATPKPRLAYAALATQFAEISPTIAVVRQAISDIRSGKFPDWTQVGTAGSFFKNPLITQAQYDALCTQYNDLPGFATDDGMVKVPLGWILDKVCGLRGYTKNGIACYEGQALVLTAVRGSSAAAVSTFADEVAERVREKTGIEIEWEVRRLS